MSQSFCTLLWETSKAYRLSLCVDLVYVLNCLTGLKWPDVPCYHYTVAPLPPPQKKKRTNKQTLVHFKNLVCFHFLEFCSLVTLFTALRTNCWESRLENIVQQQYNWLFFHGVNVWRLQANTHTHTQTVGNMHIVTAHNSASVHVFLFNETYLQHFDLFLVHNIKKV